jgi:hypothetical protein
MAARYLKGHPTLSLAKYINGPGAFDQVWRDLSVGDQVLFAAAGACAATGFELKAVAQAAGLGEETAEVGLRHLLGNGMVTALSDGSWALHPLLRERARIGREFAKAAARHGEWVLKAMGPPSEVEPVEILKDEVMAATENAIEGQDMVRLVSLCLRAELFWRTRGPWAFADRALDHAIRMTRAGGEQDQLSRLLLARAEMLKAAGDLDGAPVERGPGSP